MYRKFRRFWLFSFVNLAIYFVACRISDLSDHAGTRHVMTAEQPEAQ